MRDSNQGTFQIQIRSNTIWANLFGTRK